MRNPKIIKGEKNELLPTTIFLFFLFSATVNFRFLYDAIGACNNLGVQSNCEYENGFQQV